MDNEVEQKNWTSGTKEKSLMMSRRINVLLVLKIRVADTPQAKTATSIERSKWWLRPRWMQERCQSLACCHKQNLLSMHPANDPGTILNALDTSRMSAARARSQACWHAKHDGGSKDQENPEAKSNNSTTKCNKFPCSS
jgi:hypothetical protein